MLLRIPPDDNPDAWVRFWLDAALRCEAFQWDADQREAAELALQAAVAAAEKPAVMPAAPSDAEIDALDKTFALHVMAPRGKASVREFARAVLALSQTMQPDAYNQKLRAQLEQEWSNLQHIRRAEDKP